jgi:hypothetical protein
MRSGATRFMAWRWPVAKCLEANLTRASVLRNRAGEASAGGGDARAHTHNFEEFSSNGAPENPSECVKALTEENLSAFSGPGAQSNLFLHIIVSSSYYALCGTRNPLSCFRHVIY